MLQQGVIGAPGSTADGQNPVQLMGRAGEVIGCELRGKFYTANYRGNHFIASVPGGTAITLPVNATSLASTFCLVNPLGSGKNLELVQFDYYMVSATEVVNTIGIVYQTGLNTQLGTGGLSSITAGTIRGGVIGQTPGSVAQYYSAATHTGTPTWFMGLVDIDATAVGVFLKNYIFDGRVIVPPGTVIDIATSTGAQANSVCQLSWNEWPV